MKLGRWKKDPGIPGVQAPLSFTGDYVISHRTNCHTLSYRPPGEHHHVGIYETAHEAMRAAREHAKGAKPALQIWPPPERNTDP